MSRARIGQWSLSGRGAGDCFREEQRCSCDGDVDVVSDEIKFARRLSGLFVLRSSTPLWTFHCAKKTLSVSEILVRCINSFDAQNRQKALQLLVGAEVSRFRTSFTYESRPRS